jgi:predicted nucleic acid-binding protein
VVKTSAAFSAVESLRANRDPSIAAISSPGTSSRRHLQAPLTSTTGVSEKISTLTSIRLLGNGLISERGLVDTSVVVALGAIETKRLPVDMAVSALTLAELAGGPATASSDLVRVRRRERIQRAESTFETLSFDSAYARAYGRVCAEVVAAGRKPGRARSVDLMIAATALAHRLPFYTLNASDLRGLDELIEIVDLG